MTVKEAEGLVVKLLVVAVMTAFIVWAAWKTYESNPDIKYFNEQRERLEGRGD